VMFLAMTRASSRWTRSVKDWTAALNQLMIKFGDRIPV
jgi:transposase-like protein